MKLDANVLSAFGLEEAWRLVTVKSDLCIRGIMTNENIVCFSEVGNALKKAEIGGGAGGIVGIVNPE